MVKVISLSSAVACAYTYSISSLPFIQAHLGPSPAYTRLRPRTVIRRAEKFDLVMCARLCAIGRSGRGRGAHRMPERRRRVYSLLPWRARCTRVCCGRRVRACFVASGKLNVLITTAGAIKPLRPYPREVATRGGAPPRSTSAGSPTDTL